MEPYRLVSWERHWYLVARGTETGQWHITDPPDLVEHVRTLGKRYLRATE